MFFRSDLVGPGVNEGEEVLLVTHGDGAAVRRPGDVDVLPLGVDGGHGLAGPRVPHTDCFVSAGGSEQVRLGRMPRELVNTVTVALEHVFLAQSVRSKTENTNCLVITPTGQLLPVTAPVDAVDLGAVGHHLPGLVVLLEPGLDVVHLGAGTDHSAGIFYFSQFNLQFTLK